MGNKSSERDCFDLFRNDNPKSTLGISVKKLLVGDIIESEKPDFVIGDVGIEHFLVDQLFTKKKSQAMSIERKNKSLIKSKVDNYCKHPQELDEDIDNGAAAKFVEDIVNSQVNATSTFSFNDFVDNFKRIFNNHYNNRFEYRERCSKLGFLIEIPYGESHYIISQKNKYRKQILETMPLPQVYYACTALYPKFVALQKNSKLAMANISFVRGLKFLFRLLPSKSASLMSSTTSMPSAPI